MKIMMYGTPLSGQTTSLVQIVEHAKEHYRVGDDFYSFFWPSKDCLEEVTVYKGFYSRRAFLNFLGNGIDVDGVDEVLPSIEGCLFVVDSQRLRHDWNMSTFSKLCDVLHRNGKDPETFPVVFLFNKRELPDLLEPEVLKRELQWPRSAYFETIAINGTGVIEAMHTLVKMIDGSED
tara:strand:+ start:2533 stop:3063 length:531 start_codon:yes stop_codon:yes gene_type:complete